MIFKLQRRHLIIVSNKRRKKTKKSGKDRQIGFILFLVLGGLFTCLAFFLSYVLYQIQVLQKYQSQQEVEQGDLELIVDLLTINPYSRPGIVRKKTKGIVIHYVANPMSSAKQNRDYFESLKYRHDRQASSHFIVGLDGEIIQCIPSEEISYASNNRNNDTISIEVCHPDETGRFKGKTYDSLVKLTAFMADKYQIKQKEIIRHYDVTGKLCPKYYVEHEEKWIQLKKDIEREREKRKALLSNKD